MSNIELTVGLPIYRTKYIAWMALESLCRQEQINFDWELIVVEESYDSALPFGKDNIMSYAKRLKKVRCKNIIYMPLDEWIPLSLKWFMIADNASSTSICMLLQGGDDYSSPGRLKETLKLFKTKNADWVHNKNYVFYNIINEKIIVFSHDQVRHPCGADKAIRLSLLKSMKNNAVRRGVDKFLYVQCESIKGKDFKVVYDETDNWKYSICSSGLNNLSSRCEMNTMSDMSDAIIPLIPEDILNRLKESKKYAEIWRRI